MMSKWKIYSSTFAVDLVKTRALHVCTQYLNGIATLQMVYLHLKMKCIEANLFYFCIELVVESVAFLRLFLLGIKDSFFYLFLL